MRGRAHFNRLFGADQTVVALSSGARRMSADDENCEGGVSINIDRGRREQRRQGDVQEVEVVTQSTVVWSRSPEDGQSR
jgi:hypothetical protein